MEIQTMQMIAGNHSLVIHQHYIRIARLQSLAQFLRATLDELDNELCELKNSDSDRPEREAEFERLKDLFFKTRRKVDGYREREGELRATLTSIPKRLIATLLSIVARDGNPSVSTMKADYASVTRKLHAAEDEMDNSKTNFSQARDALKNLDRPIDSVEFAIKKLEDELDDVMSKIQAEHKTINTCIQVAATNTTIPILYKRAAVLGDSPLLAKMLRLKSALAWLRFLQKHCDLPEVPDTVFVNLNEFDDAMAKSMKLETATLHGNAQLNGVGTAHKKVTVRSNNQSRTKWKEINVSFNGPVPVSHDWRYPHWNTRAISKRTADTAGYFFTQGMTRVCDTDRSALIRDVSTEIQRLTAEIRSSWEIVSQTADTTMH